MVSSIGFIVGVKAVSGPGVIVCRSRREIVRYPVQIGFYGAGVAFDLSDIKSMDVLSTNIGATLITRGVNADAAFAVSGRNGASFTVGLIGEEAYGLGVRALGRYFEIRPR